jgi:hypothetical protein
MSTGDIVGFCILGGALLLALLVAAFHVAYAAGWNASVRHHMGRDPMDPTWSTYR